MQKQELKELLKEDRALYIPHIKGVMGRLVARYTHIEEWEIYKFVEWSRKAEYYSNRRGLYSKLISIRCIRKANILGEKLGFFIAPQVLPRKVIFYHKNITINTQSKIGQGCKFHGNNCIGNNGINNKCPVIGNNVDIGAGAKIIGDVRIADNVIIGANAVVTKSCLSEKSLLVGIPAQKKEIERK